MNSLFLPFLLAFCPELVFGAAPPFGALAVKNGRLVGSNGAQVQLRGMSLWFSQWITEFWSAGVVQSLKCNWNANVVRAAMGIDFSGYMDNPKAEWNKVVTVADAAVSNGIYVLIDWHYIGNGNYSNSASFGNYQNWAVKFFDGMSKKYKGVPNVLYEIWNEPTDIPWATLKNYHAAVIKAIRANDANAVIVCGTPSWSNGPDDTVTNSPISGYSNILYTLHWYTVGAAHNQDQRKMVTKALGKGIGTFVTEYGTTDIQATAPVNSTETKLWWDFMDTNKISYINWSMVNKEENTAAIIPSCGASGVSSDSCLSASGKLVKNKLKSVNNGISGCSG